MLSNKSKHLSKYILAYEEYIYLFDDRLKALSKNVILSNDRNKNRAKTLNSAG